MMIRFPLMRHKVIKSLLVMTQFQVGTAKLLPWLTCAQLVAHIWLCSHDNIRYRWMATPYLVVKLSLIISRHICSLRHLNFAVPTKNNHSRLSIAVPPQFSVHWPPSVGWLAYSEVPTILGEEKIVGIKSKEDPHNRGVQEWRWRR